MPNPLVPNSSSMQQSLTGQTIAPAETSPNGIPPDMSSYDQAIQDAEGKLTGILNQYPDIDYMGKYKEILTQTQNRPVDAAPNPLLSFAYSLGSPQAAPAILHQKVMKRQQQEEQKATDMMVLQEHLLQGSIQQEIAKGNFKLGLSQAKSLSELQEALAQKHRAQDNTDWEHRQTIKTKDASSLVKERVKAIAANFNFDSKETLMLESAIMHTIGTMASKPDMLGNYPDMNMLLDQYAPQIQALAAQIVANRKGGKPATPTTKPTTDRTGIGAVIKGMQTPEGK